VASTRREGCEYRDVDGHNISQICNSGICCGQKASIIKKGDDAPTAAGKAKGGPHPIGATSRHP